MKQQFGKTLPIEKPLFQQNYQKLSKVQTKKVKIKLKQKATLLTFEHDSVLRWSLSHTSSNKNRNFLERLFQFYLKRLLLSLLTPN
jgi:hypothetical protein